MCDHENLMDELAIAHAKLQSQRERGEKGNKVT
jgi:hypothetical protein